MIGLGLPSRGWGAAQQGLGGLQAVLSRNLYVTVVCDMILRRLQSILLLGGGFLHYKFGTIATDMAVCVSPSIKHTPSIKDTPLIIIKLYYTQCRFTWRKTVLQMQLTNLMPVIQHACRLSRK